MWMATFSAIMKVNRIESTIDSKVDSKSKSLKVSWFYGINWMLRGK